MQGLGTSQDRRQGLDGGAEQVVVRLLGRKGHTGGLSVETEHPGAGIFSSEPVSNDIGPHSAGGPKLGYLLEQVALGHERKKDRRPANSSTSRPTSTAACTYAMALEKVNASS